MHARGLSSRRAAGRKEIYLFDSKGDRVRVRKQTSLRENLEKATLPSQREAVYCQLRPIRSPFRGALLSSPARRSVPHGERRCVEGPAEVAALTSTE